MSSELKKTHPVRKMLGIFALFGLAVAGLWAYQNHQSTH